MQLNEETHWRQWVFACLLNYLKIVLLKKPKFMTINNYRGFFVNILSNKL